MEARDYKWYNITLLAFKRIFLEKSARQNKVFY